MEKTFNARIKLKRDTATNWESNNPVLLNGEYIIVEMTDGELRAKTGDGVSTYSQLPFNDEAVREMIDNVSGGFAATEADMGRTTVITYEENETGGTTAVIA